MFEVRGRTAALAVDKLRGEADRQPVVHRLVDAGVNARTLIIRVVYDAGVIQIGDGGHVGRFVVTALEAQLVVHRKGRAEDVVLPVVGNAFGVVHFFAGADDRTDQRVELLAAVIIFESAHILLEADELVGTHRLDKLHRFGDGQFCLISHVEIAFGTAFGLDQDDTVRAARTVDGHRRSVFQHRHVLDDVRVEVGQSAGVGNTVENNQRIIIGRQRVLAADQQGLVAARGFVAGCDVQTGHLSDQAVHQVVGRNHLQRLFVDYGQASREVLLLLRTVTHDDDLFERLCARDHFYVDDSGYADFDFLVIVAQARKYQGRGGGNFQFEGALYGGDGSRIRFSVFYNNDDARQRGSVFIDDRTGHFDIVLLGKRRCCGQQG